LKTIVNDSTAALKLNVMDWELLFSHQAGEAVAKVCPPQVYDVFDSVLTPTAVADTVIPEPALKYGYPVAGITVADEYVERLHGD
jgi:hypothetical protein